MTAQEIIQGQPVHCKPYVQNHPVIANKPQIWLPNTSWHLFDSLDPIIRYVQESVTPESWVIVNSDSEALFWGQINLLKELLKQVDHPASQFCFISSAMPNSRTLSRFRDLIPDPEINLFCVSNWQNAAYDSNPLGTEVAQTRPVVKSKLYTCFNNGPKPHRYGIVSELILAGLEDRGYVSLHNIDSHEAINYSKGSVVFPDLIDRWRSAWALKSDTLPWLLNYQVSDFFNIKPQDLKMLNDSYLSIITETLYMNPENSISDTYSVEPSYSSDFATEKTFRTMRACHPAIWVTTPGFLHSLKELGFKTFSPWIDERYDLIENDQDRMNAIVAEICRLSRQTDHEWIQWQAGVQPVLEHNVNHLLKFRNQCVHHTEFDNYIAQINTEETQ